MRVTLFTDPGCPFGFNAQRQELQLMWHYGHATQIERRMIVLQERSLTFGEGVRPTAEMVARGRERLRELYGMPMGLEPVLRLAATIEACRAFVGARMHARARGCAAAEPAPARTFRPATAGRSRDDRRRRA